MTLIEKEIDFTKPLSKKQIKMLKKAEKMPISKDDDYPCFTKEELKLFYRIKCKKELKDKNK